MASGSSNPSPPFLGPIGVTNEQAAMLAGSIPLGGSRLESTGQQVSSCPPMMTYGMPLISPVPYQQYYWPLTQHVAPKPVVPQPGANPFQDAIRRPGSWPQENPVPMPHPQTQSGGSLPGDTRYNVRPHTVINNGSLFSHQLPPHSEYIQPRPLGPRPQMGEGLLGQMGHDPLGQNHMTERILQPPPLPPRHGRQDKVHDRAASDGCRFTSPRGQPPPKPPRRRTYEHQELHSSLKCGQDTASVGGLGWQMQEVMEDLERKMAQMLEEKLAAFRTQTPEFQAPARRIPTFTDLSGYPDWNPEDPMSFKGELNSREYLLMEFKGAHPDGKTNSSLASDCKAFLQDALQIGRERRLPHKKCLQLINRHTRFEAKLLVSQQLRDPKCTLESVVRCLEQRYMGLVEPDVALSQLYAIQRESGESLQALTLRLSDRAQMATRLTDPADKRIQEEQDMVRERLLCLLPSTARNILRERIKARILLNKPSYSLAELVEEAVVCEEENVDKGTCENQQGGKDLMSGLSSGSSPILFVKNFEKQNRSQRSRQN